jgi:hypothetical protein
VLKEPDPLAGGAAMNSSGPFFHPLDCLEIRDRVSADRPFDGLKIGAH